MRHRIAKPENSGILGELNHLLIKDEGHRNSMSIPELVTDYSLSLEIYTQG
jgi:hypothetical protein